MELGLGLVGIGIVVGFNVNSCRRCDIRSAFLMVRASSHTAARVSRLIEHLKSIAMFTVHAAPHRAILQSAVCRNRTCLDLCRLLLTFDLTVCSSH